MKRMMGAAVLALVAAEAGAAACVNGTLADYIGLGATGCEIGGSTLSEFGTLAVPFAATAIDAADIGVNPVAGGPFGFGLDFIFGALTAGPGQLFEVLVGYSVSGAGVAGASARLDGATATDDGVVTLVTDLCRDGAFAAGPGTCNGAASPALVAFSASFDAVPLDQQAFDRSGRLSVIADIAIDGGQVGTASLVGAGNRFVAAAPTPGVFALLGIGLAGFAASRGRRMTNASGRLRAA